MKVVLFCGGQGTRLRDYSETIPKPMVNVGDRPILWHVMKYYADHGHKDFVLCLGHRAESIKDFFLHYEEAVSNDFVLHQGGERIELLNSDIEDWTITFVNTGLNANIGERLLAVRDHLAGEEVFLANYADTLTDLPLPAYVGEFTQRDVVAAFVAVPTPQSYHAVRFDEDGWVNDALPISEAGIWINGGFFVFRQAIFDYIEPGEELVMEPFQRLIKDQELYGHRFSGFWAPMDTFKDKMRLDALYGSGEVPWLVQR